MAVTDKTGGAEGRTAPSAGDAPAGESSSSSPSSSSSKATLRMQPTTLERWQVFAYMAALLMVFIGERILAAYDWARWVFSGLGVAALLALTALRFVNAGKHTAERRSAELTLAKLSAGGVVAVLLYFATTETGKRLLGIATAAPDTRARIEGALLVVWVVLLVISVVPLLFGERALAPMRGAERIEQRRVRSATISGLTLAFALVYCALLTYGVGELDKKADFSYFRTARPSDATKNIAQSLTEPVKVTAFFPELNEVGTEVRGYLDELRRASADQLTIEVHDRLLVPAVAKEARVTQDGTIVLNRGTSRETLTVGAEMKTAAAKLKSLDGDFQKALIKVIRSQRIAYFTVGHGELNEAAAGAPGASEGRTSKVLKKVLEQQNYSVKDLGIGQGLSNEVPKDAHVVMVLGPSRELLPEEVTALGRFADRGGKLLLALDPDAKVDFSKLAEIVDLTWQPATLATDDARHFYARRRNTSDRAILITNRYSSHASVTTLSRNSARAFLVFPGVSSIDKKEGSTAKIDFTVRAFGDAWNDLDGDFEFDDGTEKKAVYNLAAAVSRPTKDAPEQAPKKDAPPDETRAFVIADADALSDAALANEPNLVLLVDAMRWLGGEESFIGGVTTTEDVRIEHTKQKDIVWFYGTIFAAPALVLGLGLLYSRRARSRKSSASAPAAVAAKPSGMRDVDEPTIKSKRVVDKAEKAEKVKVKAKAKPGAEQLDREATRKAEAAPAEADDEPGRDEDEDEDVDEVERKASDKPTDKAKDRGKAGEEDKSV